MRYAEDQKSKVEQKKETGERVEYEGKGKYLLFNF